MTAEFKSRLMAIMDELSENKCPAIFIIRYADEITTVRNSNDRVTSELFIEYMNDSEEKQTAFLERLEYKLANIPNVSAEQPTTDGRSAE